MQVDLVAGGVLSEVHVGKRVASLDHLEQRGREGSYDGLWSVSGDLRERSSEG